MKQFLTVFFCLLASITGYAENKIKMVTYFPVPYVAYSKVNASKQLDIGLTSACTMNLGCTESGNAGLRPLNVTNTVLKKGKLELNTATAVSGSTASIGSGSGSGSMNFSSNLRVNTLNDGVSVEANNITVDTLKLFPNRITTDFPSCASTGAPGTPNISWQKLKLKDKEEVYLMCGNAKEAEPEIDCSKGPEGNSKYRTCSCGGKIYSYWNVSQCKYIEDDYVDATVSCMTYYCSSDDGNHLQSSGCWLEDILSFDVDLYTYARGRGYWKKTDLRHTQSTSIKWTDSCGWPDGLYLDNSSCETKFGLTSSGASSKTVTCGDCTYKISLETDSSEEEWNSSYCMGLNF